MIYFNITKSIFIKQTSWTASKHATCFKKRASRSQIYLCSFFISYYTSTIFAWLIYFRACIKVLISPHKDFYFTCLSDMMIEISCFRFYLIDFIIRNWKLVLFLFVFGFFLLKLTEMISSIYNLIPPCILFDIPGILLVIFLTVESGPISDNLCKIVSIYSRLFSDRGDVLCFVFILALLFHYSQSINCTTKH